MDLRTTVDTHLDAFGEPDSERRVALLSQVWAGHALDLRAPIWLIIVLALAGVGVGHVTLRRIKNGRRSWTQVGGPGPGASRDHTHPQIRR